MVGGGFCLLFNAVKSQALGGAPTAGFIVGAQFIAPEESKPKSRGRGPVRRQTLLANAPKESAEKSVPAGSMGSSKGGAFFDVGSEQKAAASFHQKPKSAPPRYAHRGCGIGVR